MNNLARNLWGSKVVVKLPNKYLLTKGAMIQPSEYSYIILHLTDGILTP